MDNSASRGSADRLGRIVVAAAAVAVVEVFADVAQTLTGSLEEEDGVDIGVYVSE